MTLRITLNGAPRTKKTHNQVFPMISGEGLKTLVRRLQEATSHKESIKALMSEISFSVHPSEGFQEWFDLVYLQRSAIQSALVRAGVKLPITDPVSISAVFYREF